MVVGCSDAPPPPPVSVVIGAAGRIGGVLYDRTAIVIEGDRIQAAGGQGDVPIPAATGKTDLTGKFLIDVPEPGKPATFTVVVCNPEPEPACRDKVLRHMKDGKWVD
jgi:hypothetical protein